MASQLLIDKASGRVSIRCWGNFSIVDTETGAELRPRSRKGRALLAYLALHPAKPVSRERLGGLLWSERADDQARGSLRQTLFELRGLSQGRHPLLVVDREMVALAPDAVETDMDAWRQLADAGAYDALLAALPDTDDTLLANLDGVDPGFDDWLQVERTRRLDALATLLTDASAGALASGNARASRQLHARLAEIVPAGDTPQLQPVPAFAGLLEPQRPGAVPPRRWRWAAAACLAVGGVGAIGAAWPGRAPPATASPRNSEAYGLYATAMPLIRQRGEGVGTAVELLRRAVVLDPQFARGWAALATAVAMSDYGERGVTEAERDARRALALDPNLADAHAALGMVLGFNSAEAGAHLKRAIALNPNDPQTLFWFSNYLYGNLEFGERLKMLRRVAALDPSWPRGVNMAANATWEMGAHDESRRLVQALERIDPEAALSCDYQADLSSGQFVAIVKKMAPARERMGKVGADYNMGVALLTLGNIEPARLLLRLPAYQWEIATRDAPSADAIARAEAGTATNMLDSDYFMSLAIQKALRAGDAARIVALYDRHGEGDLGQLGLGKASPQVLARYGADMALALRAVGRDREADSLLARVEREIRRAYSQGPAPDWFDASAAKLWAAQGKRVDALTALARAVNRGWHYAPMTPLPDIADIYAFRTLAGDPKFEAIRAQLNGHLARERRALSTVLV